MSLALKPMKTVAISDSLLDLTDMDTFPVFTGSPQVTYQSYGSTSISSNNVSYAIVPPQGVFTSRNIVHSVPFRLTITGRVIASNGAFVPNSTLLNAQKFGLRQYPIMNMTNSVTCQLNSDTYTSNVGDAFSMLARYNMAQSTQDMDSSSTPCYPDQTSSYSSLPAGSNRNPLGNFANSDAHIQRGAFGGMRIVTNPVVVPAVGAGTSVTCVVDCLCEESVMISPLFFGSLKRDVQAFFGLNNINLSFNFFQGLGGKFASYSDEAIAVSGADTVTGVVDNIAIQFNNFTGPAFSFSQAIPQLRLKYLTPNPLMVPQPNLLGTYNYAYYDQNMQTTAIGTVPYSATGTRQVVMNSITLSQIPRKVYICVKPNSQTLQNRADLTDTFLTIEGIRIQFNNQDNILGGATQKQLYDICVKNGLQNIPYSSFAGQPITNGAFLGTAGAGTYCGQGSPLCLLFSEDIYLPSDQAAGLSNGNFQFSATLNIANRNSTGRLDAVPMDIVALFVSDGVMTYTQGNISHQVSVLSSQDVLNAREMPGLSMNNFRSDPTILGAGWMDDLGNFAGKVNDFLKQSKIISTVGKAVSPYLPGPASIIGNTASSVADQLGYGYSVGGRMMEKRSLKYR